MSRRYFGLDIRGALEVLLLKVKMADVYMDSILAQLSTLELDSLLEICDKFTITIPEEKKTMRAVVVALFMAFITKDEILKSTDQGEDMLRLIDGEIGKKLKSVAKTGTKVTNAGNGKSSNSITDEKDQNVKKEETEKDESNSPGEKDRLRFLRNINLKDFKINGTVGGGSGCIEYRDLSFQMTQGKTNGYTMQQIRLGVIRAMKPGSSLKKYFEGAMSLSDENFIQMLRSHYKVQDATTLFNTMIGAAQEPMELETDFVLRMLDLRNGIITLSKEEDCQFDETLVRKKFVHALSVGFAEDTVRLELRSLLKDHTIEDHILLEEVSTVMQRECEHKTKLKHKYKETKAAVKEVREEMSSSASNKSQDVLLGEIQSLAAQVGEIMKMVGNVEEYRQEVRALRHQVETLQCAIGVYDDSYYEGYDSDWIGGDRRWLGNWYSGGNNSSSATGNYRGSNHRGGGGVTFSSGRGTNAGRGGSRGRGGGHTMSRGAVCGGFAGATSAGRGGFSNPSAGGRGGFHDSTSGGHDSYVNNGARDQANRGARGGRGGGRGVGRGSGRGGRAPRPFLKCTPCEENNLRCDHCTTCGGDDHKRAECLNG